MTVLEGLAYAIARGATRAYLDVLEERKRAEEEVPTDEDRARAARMHDAVLREQQGHHPEPDGAPPRGA